MAFDDNSKNKINDIDHVPQTLVPTAQRHGSLKRRASQGPITDPVDYSSFLCGLAAGVMQAGIFNPYDRALYLSVKDHRPFLSVENWKSPYSGFFQSIGSRALSGGLYFPLEHLFLRLVDEQQSSPVRNFVAGTATGGVMAIILNPLSAIRYKTWGRDVNRGMWTEAFGMIRNSGGSVRPFMNGMGPTLSRDAVFGGCYTWMRLQIQWWGDLPQHEQWKANLIAAGLATVASGPFNYVRNVQYATRSKDTADGTSRILRELVVQVNQLETTLQKLHFVQNRLRIGWGTMRVAMGVALGHSVYDWLHDKVKWT